MSKIAEMVVLVKPAGMEQPIPRIRIDEMLRRTCNRNGLVIYKEGDVNLTYEKALDFYSPHQGKWFCEPMAEQISGKWLRYYFIKGPYVIRIIRNLLGPNDPIKAMVKSPGSIRGQFAEGDMAKLAKQKFVVDNCGHGSDNVANGKREIAIIEEARCK